MKRRRRAPADARVIRFRLLTLSQRQPDWVDAGFREYQKRLSAGVQLELVELPLPKRGGGGASDRVKLREAELLRKHYSPRAIRVALDETGRSLDTGQFARQLGEWLEQGQDVDLLVGGPDGLADAVREEAQFAWSLSPLTFPHGLVRVVVAEQIYRGWTVLQGHPYHRS